MPLMILWLSFKLRNERSYQLEMGQYSKFNLGLEN